MSTVMQDRFFVLVKPDGVSRGLVGKIISRFEKRGFHLECLEMTSGSDLRILDIFSPHASEHYYDSLVGHVTKSKVVAMCWKGNIKIARRIVGATNPTEAKAESIRGSFASNILENLVHASRDSTIADKELLAWGW